MPRIGLLKEKEIREFDSPKMLTPEQRTQLFDEGGMENTDRSFRKPITRIGFVLQRGYFIVHKKFFAPDQFHLEDIAYVSKLFSENTADIKSYKRQSLQDHRHLILNQQGFISFSEGKEVFENEVRELVKTSLRPRALFFALNDFLVSRKIECPRYYVFAESIGKALNSFEQNLVSNVDKSLAEGQKSLLDGLMALPADPEDSSGRNPYLITTLKKPSQALAPKRIRESINDFHIISDLHSQLIEVVEHSGISRELLNYYAVWIIKAKYVQFDSIRHIEKKRLYLIAFIIYQYRIRQDLFVDTFLQSVQKYLNDIDKRVKDGFLNRNDKIPASKGKLSKIRNIILSSKDQMGRVRKILFDEKYGDTEKLYLLRDVVGYGNRAFHDELLAEIEDFENSGSAKLRERMRFEQLEKGYRRIQNRVGGILQILDFNPSTSNPHILEAVQYYQAVNGKITSKAPTDFMMAKNDLKRIFLGNGEFIPGLYKVLLFREVANHIKAGALNLRHSDKYMSIDEYLIPPKRWGVNRMSFLERAGIADLEDIDLFLTNSKADLHNQYNRTNAHAADNVHLRFGRNGKAIVKTPKIEATETDGILKLLDKDRFRPLISILSDIRHATDFTESFLHYSRKSTKKIPSDDIMYAAIIALGCNIGVRKMGKISKGIGADRLEYAVRWYFGKENIDDANLRIVSFTNELSLPTIFEKDKKRRHTSSDGQKFDVTVPSLHATHSYKYFGFGKGVSAYSFIDEKSRLFYSTVISASEREAGYVLDGLMHSDGMESNVHSTDTHGYSEIVFGLCNALGIFFAPRIKNYKDQLLYTFKENPRRLYEKNDFRILPSKSLYIDEKILKAQWESILRLLCSIKLKETKPSKVLGRLSSYSKQHPLYKALKELGRIFKSIFILRYLDEIPLRQGIEKQLNRIEQSHQFAKAVFFGNNQEFKFETKEEQEISVSCRHLIQNAIVLWNYMYISGKLAETTNKEEHNRILESLGNSSIMTWQHVNLHGEYDFNMTTDTASFNLDKILSLKLDLDKISP